MYTDKHGEVCPAGWKPGADTIIPDPKVLVYFTEERCEVLTQNFRRNWSTSRNRVTCEDGTKGAMVVKFYKTLSVIHMCDKATTF